MTKVRKFLFVISVYFFVLGGVLFFIFSKQFAFVPVDLLLNYYPWKIYKPEPFYPYNPLRSDILDFYLPRISILKSEIFDKNIIPLWTTLISNGRPLFTMVFNAFLHPFWILAIVFSVPIGASLVNLAKMFFAFLFMYMYLKKIGINTIYSIIGGIIYTLAGFNSVWLNWPHVLVSSFAPFMFWGIEKFLERRTFRSGIYFVFAIVSLIFGGMPSIAGYFLYLSVFYFLMRLFWMKIPKRDTIKILLKFSLLIIIGILLTSIQLIPTIEFFNFIDISYRVKNSLRHLPLSSLIQLFLPFFYGSPSFYNWKGYSNFNETSGYTGVVSFIFLVGVPIFLFLRKIKTIKLLISDIFLKNLLFFWSSSVISLSIIYKIGPFFDIVRFLPIFSTNSNTRLFSVFAFSQAVGTSLMLSIIASTTIESKAVRKIIKFGTTIFLFFLALMLGIGIYKVFFYYPVAKMSKPFIFSHLSFLRWINFVWFIFQTGVTVLLVYFLLLNKNKKNVVNILFALFVSLDMLFFNYRQNGIVRREYFFPETKGISYLKENLKPYERVATFDGVFMIPGTQLAYNINSAFTHSFYSKDHKFLIDLFIKKAFVTPTAIQPLSKNTNFLSPLIDIFGIKYIVFPPDGILYSYVISQNINIVDIGKIWKDRYVIQTFQIPNNYTLNRLCLLFATYKKRVFGNGQILIIDTKGKTIAKQSFKLFHLKDNTWECFDFNVVLKKGSYKIKIVSDASEENSITIWSSGNKDLYRDGEVITNREKTRGDLTFRAYFQNKELNDKYTLVYKGNDMVVYKNNSFNSGIFLVNRILFYEDKEDIREYLNLNSFDPEQEVFIKKGVLNKFKAEQCGVKKGKIELYSANKLKYIINTDCDAILITPEIWYPGWKVYVNGKEGDILKVNLIFRGVLVPKGNNEVYFVYNPISFKVGVLVSFLSLIFFLTLITLERFYSKPLT